ncbi:unnamed protein product [Rotaria sordida]|uniref:Uncharacterized protein n=1 Tax=Rotaria sordida TaxID=392033 RepID=A0A818NW77_9BILA|nr:unnamed protein product [Rotaria sordida]CAF3611632.1 unnamed protein product [Rotaria sordida]
MASSTVRTCAIVTCKRSSFALCHCCEEHLCINHLNEHSNLLNTKLIPLTDEINTLLDRIKRESLTESSCLKDLEEWRREAHQIVDRFYETKRKQLINEISKDKTIELDRLKFKIDTLIREQDATQDQIDLITEKIRSIKQAIDEFQNLGLIIHPFTIDDNLIVLKSNAFLPLRTASRTMSYTASNSAMASNEKHVLIENESNLCLVNDRLTVTKKTLWTFGDIWGMCWSSTLARFIIVTNNILFILDEKTMTLTQCQISSDKNWYGGTCSNTTLFLSTWQLREGSNIIEYSLPSIQYMKQWQPPLTCNKNEWIEDFEFKNSSLAMIILHSSGRKCGRFELRSSSTLQCLWSIALDGGYRCYSINYDQWIVIKNKQAEILHISNDGRILEQQQYDSQIKNVAVLNNNILMIKTADRINLYEI